jgi:hypothetical protein
LILSAVASPGFLQQHTCCLSAVVAVREPGTREESVSSASPVSRHAKSCGGGRSSLSCPPCPVSRGCASGRLQPSLGPGWPRLQSGLALVEMVTVMYFFTAYTLMLNFVSSPPPKKRKNKAWIDYAQKLITPAPLTCHAAIVTCKLRHRIVPVRCFLGMAGAGWLGGSLYAGAPCPERNLREPTQPTPSESLRPVG